MDLSSYSRTDLAKLRRQVDQELESRRRVEQRTARQEVRDIAQKYGISLADLVTGTSTQPSGKGGGLAYQSPYDPSKTWGGRGRKPKWIKEWENSGRSLDELRA